MFTNLRELIASMPDEKQCRDYLVTQRWPDGKPVCPYCGSTHIYRVKERDRFKCGNPECYKKFSVTVGTIFEASKIPLFKWLTAVYLSSAHKKGISSYQLGRDVGVSQKTGWFMLHRIREMMRMKEMFKLDNIVEIDEVYMGGKVGNMSKSKRKMLRETGQVGNTKTMVMGLIERGGNLKLITLAKDNGTLTLQPVIRDNVDTDAVVITDGLPSYNGLENDFAGHEVVNHIQGEYVRDGSIHTNSIEGVFSHFKRSIYGIYHSASLKHLSRYADETMYRYNTRKIKDADRFNLSLQRIEGRLTYKQLIQKPSTPTPQAKKLIAEYNSKKRSHAVIQLKGNTIIAEYKSIAEAAKVTGFHRSRIARVVQGHKHTTGGFKWKYA